jgi:hypothetical protein
MFDSMISKSKASDSYFRLAQEGERWWLVQPNGDLFFSLGLNHVDPAGLRYSENRSIWQVRYENSMEKWLKESVHPNLSSWGFNTLGWNREMAVNSEKIHRHSRHFTYDEYQWLDMPYCHQLPFGEFHQWEAETVHPDFFTEDFVNWCDYVAREHCVPLANDPKLIGYFYIDCPTWTHTRPKTHWKGPLFDPAKLDTEKGRKELYQMAERYYQVTRDAIRRYDKNHLILGDRYEANEPLEMEVVDAAKPYVDVLSFQDFRDPVGNLKEWHERTGMPVLWADGSSVIIVETESGVYRRNDGPWYREALAGLRKNPGCIGAHLCGAYMRNRARRKGLLDENENPDEEMIAAIRKGNLETSRWVTAANDRLR